MKIKFSIFKCLSAILLIGVVITGGVWLQKVVGFADSMGCVSELIQQSDSPDRAFSVFKYKHKCGATAPDTLQVSIQPFGTKFDVDKFPPFLVLDHRANAFLKWDKQKSLTVRLGNVRRTYRSDNDSIGVHINYE